MIQEDDTCRINHEICFQDLHSILLDKKTYVDRFPEKIIWSLLKISKRTDTLAEPDDNTLLKFNMKSFN